MKQFLHTGYWHTTLLVLATLLVLFGCKDTEDSSVFYPEGISYEQFNVKDVQGTIYLSDNQWFFRPDDYMAFHPTVLGDEESLSVFINDMKEEYKSYSGKRVKITGQAQFLYAILPDNPAGGAFYRYAITIKDIEVISTALRTRAGNTLHILCGTPAPYAIRVHNVNRS